MTAPSRIGPYELVRELGRGGLGVVFEARDPAGRAVALKQLLQRSGSPQALARFEREGRLLARVRHPNVLALHDLGQGPTGPYLVTELIEGEELADLVERAPPSGRRAAEVVRAVADAVAAAHAAGVLHRDLKPQNVMIRRDGRPVLLDFGLARLHDGVDRLTQTGAVVGTPAYLAPEQARGDAPDALDARADVYGLGALLYALLAGRPPFEGPQLEVLFKVVKEEPRWPSQDRPSTPAALEGICRRAMAKRPEDRYPSAAALRDDLDRWLASAPPDPEPWPRAAAAAAAGAGTGAGPAGRRLGAYTIVEELAAGGQGAVFVAQHDAGARVALKVLHRAQGSALDRFRQEARVLARLAHPNLPRVHEHGEVEGTAFLASELVAGSDLFARVRASGPPPVPWSARVLVAIAGAVEHCHQHGIVHRDLKPNNVVVEDGSGRPVLVDFGLVKRDADRMRLSSLDDQVQLSLSGTVKGTPEFMAPEQANPNKFGPLGPWTDVYGLGAILYWLLTGAPPFKSKTMALVLRAVTRKQPTDPATLNPAVPRPVAGFCLRCLAKAPAERPESAEAFARELAAVAGVEVSAAAAPAPAAGSAARRRRRAPPRAQTSWAPRAAGAVAALALAGGVAAVLLGSPEPPPRPDAAPDAAEAPAPERPAGAEAAPGDDVDGPPPPGPALAPGWQAVWRLASGQAPELLPDRASWREPGRVAAPLAALAAQAGSAVEGFLGSARSAGSGRVRVEYTDLDRALTIQAPSQVAALAQEAGAGAAVRGPDRSWRLLAPNDVGTYHVAVGRSHWDGLRVRATFSLVEQVDQEAIAFDLGVGGPAPAGLTAANRKGTLAVAPAQVAARQTLERGRWYTLEFAPGAAPSRRVLLDGRPSPELDAAADQPAGEGRLRVRLGEVHVAWRELVVEGRPLSVDLPARARVAEALSGSCRVAAAFSPGAAGPLGAFVALGSSDGRAELRLALEAGRLVLRRDLRVVGEADGAADAEWLALERRPDTLIGWAGIGPRSLARVEVADPLPLPGRALHASYGSGGPEVRFLDVQVAAGPPDVARARYDAAAASGIQAALRAAADSGDPRAALWEGALGLARVSDSAWADLVVLGPGGRATRLRTAQRAATQLEQAAAGRGGDLVARDALARAVLARVVAADGAAAARAAERLVEVAGPSGRVDLDGLERWEDQPALVRRLVAGYAPPAEGVVREAGFRAAAALAPEARGAALVGLAGAIRTRDPAPDAGTAEGRATLEEVLALLAQAREAGAARGPVAVQEAETLHALGRAGEAVAALESCAAQLDWWGWYLLATYRKELGRQPAALEAALGALAAKLHPTPIGLLVELVKAPETASVPGLRAVALAHVARSTGRDGLRASALQLALGGAAAPGREGDLAAYAAALLDGAPPERASGGPLATLLAARRGDAGARARLDALIVDDLLLRHLARLDPALDLGGGPR